MKGVRGLTTQPDPSTLTYSQSASRQTGNIGLSDFSACLNVDVLDNNMVMRRRAIVKRVDMPCHSLCPLPDYCLFGSGDGLWLLGSGFEGYQQIATVTPGNISFSVLDGVARWANGAQRGKVVDGVNQPWVKAETVYSNNQTRTFYDPPTGRFLGYYNGRMYVVIDKAIYYSEPYSPDVFAMGDSFLSLESTVTMLRPVKGGMYISDSEQTHFVSGAEPNAFDWNIIDNFPALPWSDKSAVGAMVEGSWQPGGKTEVAFWLTNNGIMFGDAGGNVVCTTETKINLPTTYTAGAILVDGTNLIAQFN